MRIANLTALLLACAPGAAWAAQDDATKKRLEALEKEVRELKQAQPKEPAKSVADAVAEWARRIRLSGSADIGYFDGGSDSIFKEGSFDVWDARLFLDVELGEDLMIGSTKIIRNAGFSFEWDLIRIRELHNRAGELYIEFQGIADSDWLNLQVGRFQLPVTENYLRFSRGQRDNPFISHTAGGLWYWDEGVKVYGKDPGKLAGYVFSVTDGENTLLPNNMLQDRDRDADHSKQLTLKLFADPADWLHVSASGLRSGTIGSPGSPASGSLWFGEMSAKQFGMASGLPNFDHGAAIPDGGNELENLVALGADVVLTWADRGRAWLAYGTLDIEDAGSSVYDRGFLYWIAELIVEGRNLGPDFAPFYLGLRASGIGTYDEDEGYMFDSRYADTIGWNMGSYEMYSVVLGWRMNEHVTLRAEFTRLDIQLVRGVTPDLRDAAEDTDYFAVSFGAGF